ncbi:MAG TPA: S8 family serine peptidase, partial [Pyrinomonadaceae bacterium]|nr:S8 family serine peptidase [Pyrinomonadaceae bacterium]
MKKSLLATALAVLSAALVVWPPPSGAQGGTQKFFHAEDAVQGQYIVVLKSETEQSLVAPTADSLAAQYGGKVRFVFEHALKGFSVAMGEADALALSEDARVELVEENGAVSLSTTQLNPPWGLDRIDQRFRPLSGTYAYDNAGGGVNVYVIDTGIRPTHVEFRPAGRAVAAADYAPTGGGNGDPPGCSNVPPILCGTGQTPAPADLTLENSDCNGHGTHVAGTVGGSTYGVAKGARLFGVRVLGCGGGGTWESVIAGVEWATAHHNQNPGPAVANMSLGGPANVSVDVAV